MGDFITGGSATDKIAGKPLPAGVGVRTVTRAVDLNDIKAAIVASVNVKHLGAKGDGVTDDTPAFNAAAVAAQEAGGATIIVPRGLYRLTDSWIIGSGRFISEDDIKYQASGASFYAPVPGTPGATSTAPSWNATQYAANGSDAAVSIRGEPGAVLWGNWTAASRKALLNYTARPQFRGAPYIPTIEGLTLVGNEAVSAGVVVKEIVPVAGNHQVGIARSVSSVNVRNVTFQTLDVGLLGNDNYWSTVSDIRGEFCNYTVYGVNENATQWHNIMSNWCRTWGILLTGSVLTLRGIHTENCLRDLWLPFGDFVNWTGGYLEGSLNDTDYSVQLGDPAWSSTAQVTRTTFNNIHISRSNENHNKLKMHATMARFSQCDLGDTAGAVLVNDVNSFPQFWDCALDFQAGAGTANAVVYLGTQGGGGKPGFQNDLRATGFVAQGVTGEKVVWGPGSSALHGAGGATIDGEVYALRSLAVTQRLSAQRASVNTVTWTGTTPVSTGINVNAGMGGGTALLMVSENHDAGNGTASAVYLLRYGYDGDNFGVTLIAGTDMAVFSVSGGVLQIAGVGAGVNYTMGVIGTRW